LWYTDLYRVYRGIYLFYLRITRYIPLYSYKPRCTSWRISSWDMLVYSGSCPRETGRYVCVSFLRILS